MTLFYVHTGGDTNNSGSTNDNTAPITLTVHASYSGSGSTIPVTVNTGSLASVITTPGDTQSTVCFADATNSSPNRKIWKISAVDNVSSPKTITLDAADPSPTGLTAGTSTAKIGGRIVWPGGSTVFHSEGSIKAGDRVRFMDSPATRTTTWITTRNNGDDTSGRIYFEGDPGLYPTLRQTQGSTSSFFAGSNGSWTFQGFTIDSDATSGSNTMITTGSNWHVNDNICIDGFSGANFLSLAGSGSLALRNKITSGHDGNAIVITATGCRASGNHCQNGGYGIATATSATPTVEISNNLIEVGGLGINLAQTNVTTSTHIISVHGNTVANCGNDGMYVADGEMNVVWSRNIFYENGGADGMNVRWNEDNAQIFGLHEYNLLYHSQVGGGAVSGVTLNSTELTSDPLFTDENNHDYSLGSSSPARNINIPLFGGVANYVNLGAVQPAGTSSGGLKRHPGMSGGLVQ